MSEAIYNLHNHTPFSDGAYTIDELCEAHLEIAAPIAGIGICDHMFCTPSSREVRNEREFEQIFVREKNSYVDDVLEARRRWADKLEILCGIEINWPLNKNMLSVIANNLGGVDYIVFEYVDWSGLTTLANQARRFPCPIGLTHTDVAESYPNTSMDQVVRTLSNARIFYELNSKMWPVSERDPWFRTLPNHRVRLTIGTDTHDDLSVLQQLPAMAEFLAKMGLENKILTPQHRSAAAVAS